MLGKIVNGMERLVGERCFLCGDIINGESLKVKVKIPTYTGRHEKSFCCDQHLKEWREHVREWERKNHEIPEKNKGPTCVNCMR